VHSETRYFDGIWTDQIAGRAVEEAVLGRLAEGAAATVEELAKETSLSAAAVADALAYLDTRDLVVVDAAGHWDLVVPLMRRWMRLRG
jgi:DNA-binding GntR family transcriptional regulator